MHKPLRRVWVLALLLLPVLGSGADENSYFRARRKALMDKIDGSAALLQGAAGTRDYAPFRQDNNFYYLTVSGNAGGIFACRRVGTALDPFPSCPKRYSGAVGGAAPVRRRTGAGGNGHRRGDGGFQAAAGTGKTKGSFQKHLHTNDPPGGCGNQPRPRSAI